MGSVRGSGPKDPTRRCSPYLCDIILLATLHPKPFHKPKMKVGNPVGAIIYFTAHCTLWPIRESKFHTDKFHAVKLLEIKQTNNWCFWLKTSVFRQPLIVLTALLLLWISLSTGEEHVRDFQNSIKSKWLFRDQVYLWVGLETKHSTHFPQT